MAFETEFGWVLSGSTDGGASQEQVNLQATAFHACAGSGDDILHNFWELEESPSNTPILSVEERTVVRHFEENHRRTVGGRFVVPLPRKADPRPLGESRSQAVQRFLSLERSLNHKNRFQEFEAVMVEYLELGHAEVVLCEDMNKPPSEVFYLRCTRCTRVPVLPPRSEPFFMLLPSHCLVCQPSRWTDRSPTLQ